MKEGPLSCASLLRNRSEIISYYLRYSVSNSSVIFACNSSLYCCLQALGEVSPFDKDRVASLVVRDVSQWFIYLFEGNVPCSSLYHINSFSVMNIPGENIVLERWLFRVDGATLCQQNYIRKLVEIFRTCEDLENDEGLQLMFKIVKGISKLNHPCIP